MYRFAAVIQVTVLVFLIFANSTESAGQPDSIYRLPIGTRIALRLDAELNSGVASVNDTFIAVAAKPVSIRGTVVLPAGATIEGRVARVTRANVGGQNGSLDLTFETLKFADGMRSIEGVMTKPIRAESSRRFTFVSIFGGIAAGAAIGAASGSGRKGLIGAGLGGGAGISVALLRKGKNVRIRKDEEFEIELKKDVMLPVLDY